MSYVYLCGPINGCTDDEANNWRDIVKAELGEENCLDPMRRDYRGREDDCVSEIVEGDKADIRNCTVMIANCWQPSVGTSMEIFYADMYARKVICVVPPDSKVSPWIRYHSDYVVTDLNEAIGMVKQWLNS